MKMLLPVISTYPETCHVDLSTELEKFKTRQPSSQARIIYHNCTMNTNESTDRTIYSPHIFRLVILVVIQ
jgi:hypothetical protein